MGRLSVVERNELWDLYEAGESQRSISRRLGRSPSTVRTQLVSAGWRRPPSVGAIRDAAMLPGPLALRIDDYRGYVVRICGNPPSWERPEHGCSAG